MIECFLRPMRICQECKSQPRFWSPSLRGALSVLLMVASIPVLRGYAGVSRAIQDKYRQKFENKALFLKVPVFSEKQYVYLRGTAINPEQGPNSGAARYKVGDQMRVVGLDFGGDEIKFKLSAIKGTGLNEVIFKFDANLVETFPNSDVFDRAVEAIFTEGLKYSDLEEAKRDYVGDQFDRAVREIAAASSSGRDSVLKNIAPLLPAYQEAQKDIENLRGRNQDLSGQITQLQGENRKLDAELRTQQAEAVRLRSTNSALQEKIDSSTSQLSRLGEDLRSARGTAQGYQKELANLQKTLNIKLDANRDLAVQIAELGQAIRKVQKENESLESQNSMLHTNVEKLQGDNSKLSSDLEDAKTSNRQMRETIGTLTSKEDSLARQYLDLKRAKENVDNVVLSVDNLNTRTIEEKTEGGRSTGRAGVFLRNIPLGTIEWSLPEHLSHNEQLPGVFTFATDSIDYVKVSPEERRILRSLGERLKLQVKLTSNLAGMDVKPEKDDAVQEVGERDRATWHWKIFNTGTQDTHLALSVRLINKNSDDVPLFHREQLVTSASVARQVRGYLQPIPIGLGALIGMMLYGIAGIFRKSKRSERATRRRAAKPPDPPPYSDQKQL
jgi:predicted nuclease with TOPRIM domain